MHFNALAFSLSLYLLWTWTKHTSNPSFRHNISREQHINSSIFWSMVLQENTDINFSILVTFCNILIVFPFSSNLVVKNTYQFQYFFELIVFWENIDINFSLLLLLYNILIVIFSLVLLTYWWICLRVVLFILK